MSGYLIQHNKQLLNAAFQWLEETLLRASKPACRARRVLRTPAHRWPRHGHASLTEFNVAPETVALRVDANVLADIKASSGWQTRVNALLREAVCQGKLTA